LISPLNLFSYLQITINNTIYHHLKFVVKILLEEHF